MPRTLIFALMLAVMTSLLTACGRTSTVPETITVDWAYYSPLSMVIKQKGWMEEEFKGDGIEVKWVLSLGSNKALEFLATGGADFGSSAGAAALMSRANGNRIRAVYVYSKPEWTALVVPPGSPIKSAADLKGRKVAATKGTDPYIFLLRILNAAGLTRNDVEIVHLQHPDGRTALERGDVEAWAGLDPHMAVSELEHGSQLAVRNPDFNTYGFLNVREEFASRYPEHTRRVLKVYEQARQWALAHPDELVQIVAEEAEISVEVARKVVGERNDFSKAVPDGEHTEGLRAASRILLDEGLIKAGTDTEQVISELIDPSFAQAVVK